MTSLEEKISELIPEEAIVFLTNHLKNNPDDEVALTLRGLRHWSLNHRKEAIEDYLHALRINPQSKAKMALDYANTILDFYNKDLLNP